MPARQNPCYIHIKVSRRYRYLDVLTLGVVVVLMVSNLVGPKICQIGWLRPRAAEGVDFFDRRTNLNPFALRREST